MAKISSRDKRQAKRDAAKERQALRDQIGDEAQLEKLISNGYGECREANRLRERINSDKE